MLDPTPADIAKAEAYAKRTKGGLREPTADEAYLNGLLAERERAAIVAGSLVGGYTANVRTSKDEQELVADPNGPWVLNSDIAKAILQGPTS